ncbi:TPA: GNVR domain-containing protein [Legionella pneumophila]
MQKSATNIDDSVSFKLILLELWVNRKLVCLSMLFSIFLAIGYIGFHQDKYTSDVLLQLPANANLNIMSGVLANKLPLTEQLGLPGSENHASIQTALIKSHFILEKVINQLHLDIQLKPTMMHFWKKIDSSIKVTDLILPRKLTNKSLQLIINKQIVSLIGPNGKLLLTGPVGKMLVSKDQQYRLMVKASPSLQETLRLKKLPIKSVIKRILRKLQVDELGGKKNSGILEIAYTSPYPEQLVAFLNAVAATVLEEDTKKKRISINRELNFLDKQLPVAKHDLTKAELKLNQYRAKSGKIDIKLQSKLILTQLAELDNELTKIRLKKIGMQQEFTQDHPFYKKLTIQLNQLKQERHELEKTLRYLPASDQTFIGLARDVAVRNKIYMFLLNKIQSLNVLKSEAVTDIRILSAAKDPDAPVPLKNIFIYGGSLLIGLMLSLFIIFGRKLAYSIARDLHVNQPDINRKNLLMGVKSKNEYYV